MNNRFKSSIFITIVIISILTLSIFVYKYWLIPKSILQLQKNTIEENIPAIVNLEIRTDINNNWQVIEEKGLKFIIKIIPGFRQHKLINNTKIAGFKAYYFDRNDERIVIGAERSHEMRKSRKSLIKYLENTMSKSNRKMADALWGKISGSNVPLSYIKGDNYFATKMLVEKDGKKLQQTLSFYPNYPDDSQIHVSFTYHKENEPDILKMIKTIILK